MSCKIPSIDICVRNGDTADAWQIQIRKTIPETGEVNALPEDLTGWEFWMDIRKGSNIEKSLSLGAGLTLGTDTLVIDRVDEVQLMQGTYTYALKYREAGSNTIRTFINGEYKVLQKIVEHV